MGVEENFYGVIDFVKMKVINWNEEDMGMIFIYEDILVEYLDIVEQYCIEMIEVVVEVFDELMNKYLEGEEFFEEEICLGFCQCMLNNEIVFVICGSVFKNKGVQVVLDFVIYYFLFLIEVKVIIGVFDDKDEIEVECYLSDDELFLVLVFKIVIDLFVGMLIFFCCYFGVVNMGDMVYNFVKGKCECFGCIV